ncbi:hypothetical protein JSY14_03825 [Brachybacterium sp. EF45031]|uniref:hypothetical protein n=1 Tax=Brachybacterium sillae TaxID=2810536 RepID=UPI00217E41DF|nr:hypothetical protein [Brachybacterium sillae]MCS6711185.1 hypothetical protein [Brachybacterium sillae]
MAESVTAPAAIAATPAAATGTLTRTLVRLHLLLWRRSFRKNIGKLIGTIFLGGYGLFLLTLLAIGLPAVAALTDPGLMRTVVLTVGTGLAVAWLVGPLLLTGLEEPLDVLRFAPLSLRGRDLRPGMLLAALLSLPGLLTLLALAILTVCEALWFMGVFSPGMMPGISPVALVLGGLLLLPCHLGLLVLCLLLPRVVITWSAARTSSRRRRELVPLLGLLVFLALIYGGALLTGGGGAVTITPDALIPVMEGAAAVLPWTPLGAFVAVPLDVAAGVWLIAAVRVVIAVAGLWLLWILWARGLDRAMVSALAGQASSGRTRVSALVPRGVPAGPFGASFGRALRYWRRDSRYLGSMAVIPLLGIFLMLMPIMAGATGPGVEVSFLGLILVGLLCGVSLGNELGFDGPAGWVQITTGASPRTDLAGRIAAIAVVTLPFVLLLAVGAAALTGRWELLVPTLLGIIGAACGGWGVSTLVGTLMPFPTAAPGTSPFKDRSSASGAAMLTLSLAMLGVLVPQIPAIVLLIVGAVTGGGGWLLAAGAASLLGGVVGLVIGVHLSGRYLEQNYARVWQRVRAFI